jgi:triphosphoribosyl-dephospho-CoA synthase
MTPGRLAALACLLEVTARKPGNVHRLRDFEDTGYLDFAASALAIGPALDRARVDGVGPAVLAAIRETRELIATNTNLGIVLLLAPLAAVPPEKTLRTGLLDVLDGTTVADTQAVYQAIRLANPGGLGDAAEQDVAAEPTLPLRAVMTLAAERDDVARQYANGYADVFDIALASLARVLSAGRALETAILCAQLTLLSARPDTLIARKRGITVACEASRRAAAALDAGWPDSAAGLTLVAEFDHWLCADGHARNPGTTADLVTAALFAGLRDGTIALPLKFATWTHPPQR